MENKTKPIKRSDALPPDIARYVPKDWQKKAEADPGYSLLAALVLDKPPHVSARCRAKSKRSGEQCKRWASIGFSTCRMHGGHAKSGRPTTNGNHTLEKKRQKRFVHIVRGLLNANAEKPLRVDPEPHTVDTTAEDNGDDKKH